MADPLILLLLVTSPDVGDNVTSAVSASAREALGPTAHVIVESRSEWPADAEALALAKRVRAKAVVELRWADAAGPRGAGGRDATRMQLHVHLTSDAGDAGEKAWIDRTLNFANVDDPVERGRTAGLAVASMMPLEWRVPEARREPAEGLRVAPDTRNERDENARHEVFSVDLSGLAALGEHGAAWGGQATARVQPGRAFALEVLGSARFGSVSSADANARTLAVGAGFAVPMVRREPWELGVSADVLALGQSLERGDATEARWLAGAQVNVEGVWFFSRRVGVVVAVGEEVAFGATRVFIGPDRVATLSLFQTLVKVGLRVRF